MRQSMRDKSSAVSADCRMQYTNTPWTGPIKLPMYSLKKMKISRDEYSRLFSRMRHMLLQSKEIQEMFDLPDISETEDELVIIQEENDSSEPELVDYD